MDRAIAEAAPKRRKDDCLRNIARAFFLQIENMSTPPQFLPKPTLGAERDSAAAMRRRIIRDAVPRATVQPAINGKAYAASPSRLWYGTDDYLARRNYKCDGPNAGTLGVGWTGVPGARMLAAAVKNCDGSGVPAASCNPRFVPDASDFGHYRAMWSVTQTYNQ